ncbi:hypothetical protein [Halorientalis sp.]|jgi:hypothetical protein|uniref:hypothetical protein n=1 Tax=Halorientalis sp. TaxID=1931229 RepID=UPI002607115F|nr:hypothetical protein [Halorientalis sp.]
MGIAPYDHYHAGPDAPIPPGVYRVVGHTDAAVTLLLVAEETGSRRATGRIETVDRETVDSLEPAANPDSGFDPSNVLEGVLLQFKMLYRKLR